MKDKKQYDPEVVKTGLRMLGWFGGKHKAAEMAELHGLEHPAGSAKRLYWQEVEDFIRDYKIPRRPR